MTTNKTERPKYRATAERDGRFWFLRVEDVPGARTQARRLDEAEDMVRDVIALVLEVEPDSFDVEIVPNFEAIYAVATARRLRKVADELESAAGDATRLAVRSLSEEGLTVRDIGQILGVSFQRADQLRKSGAITDERIQDIARRAYAAVEPVVENRPHFSRWSDIKRRKGAPDASQESPDPG